MCNFSVNWPTHAKEHWTCTEANMEATKVNLTVSSKSWSAVEASEFVRDKFGFGLFCGATTATFELCVNAQLGPGVVGSWDALLHINWIHLKFQDVKSYFLLHLSAPLHNSLTAVQNCDESTGGSYGFWFDVNLLLKRWNWSVCKFENHFFRADCKLSLVFFVHPWLTSKMSPSHSKCFATAMSFFKILSHMHLNPLMCWQFSVSPILWD